MQLIAEGYDILKRGLGLHEDEIASIFDKWNKGVLDSCRELSKEGFEITYLRSTVLSTLRFQRHPSVRQPLVFIVKQHKGVFFHANNTFDQYKCIRCI